MKKFTNLVAVFAAMILALSCFVACSNGDDDDDGPAVVSTWSSDDYGTLTLYDNGTWTCGEYSGAYKEATSATGTISGDIEGSYVISGDKMTLAMTAPSAGLATFTKK